MRKFISIVEALNEAVSPIGANIDLPEEIQAALRSIDFKVMAAEPYGDGKWEVGGVLDRAQCVLRFKAWSETPNFDYMLFACSDEFPDEAWQKVQQFLRKKPMDEAHIYPNDAQYPSYENGEYLPKARYIEMANEIIPQLSPQQRAAMVALSDHGIPVRTDWQVKISLKKMGLSTGFSRSGDNADSMTPLGKVVADMLHSSDAKMGTADHQTVLEDTLEEEKPTAPMKPGEENMARQVKQQQRDQKAPPKPQQPQGNNNAQNTAPNMAAKNDAAQAPADKEAQQAIDTVDDGIEAGEEAKRILKQAGVIESLIRESVEGMFKS